MTNPTLASLEDALLICALYYLKTTPILVEALPTYAHQEILNMLPHTRPLISSISRFLKIGNMLHGFLFLFG